MNAPKKEEASKNKYKLWSVCFSFHLQVYLFILFKKIYFVKIEGIFILVKKNFYLVDPFYLKKRNIGFVYFQNMIPEPVG